MTKKAEAAVSTATKAVVTLIVGLLVGFVLPRLWDTGSTGAALDPAVKRNDRDIQKLEREFGEHEKAANLEWKDHAKDHTETNRRLSTMEGKIDMILEVVTSGRE